MTKVINLNQFNHNILLINDDLELFMKYNKVNTFSREPSLPQIGAYIAIITQTCIFYIMVGPSYSSESSKIVFITIYTIVTSLLVIFATISSCIDPSDSIMVQYLTNN